MFKRKSRNISKNGKVMSTKCLSSSKDVANAERHSLYSILPIRIMSMLCILTFPAPRIQVGIWWWPGHRSSLHDTFYLNTWCQFRIGQDLHHLWRDTGMPTCSHSLEILQDWWQIRCHRYRFPARSQRLPYQCFVRGSNSCWLRDYHRHVSNGFWGMALGKWH